jgi:hypothetical protein
VLEWLDPCQIPAHPRVASRGVPQYESPASAASVCSETAPPYPKPRATPRGQRSRSVGGLVIGAKDVVPTERP